MGTYYTYGAVFGFVVDLEGEDFALMEAAVLKHHPELAEAQRNDDGYSWDEIVYETFVGTLGFELGYQVSFTGHAGYTSLPPFVVCVRKSVRGDNWSATPVDPEVDFYVTSEESAKIEQLRTDLGFTDSPIGWFITASVG